MNTKITMDNLVAVIRVVRENQKTQLMKIIDLENKVEDVDKLKSRIVK